MAPSNKGIINTGTIGGNASVEISEKNIAGGVTINADHSAVGLHASLDGLRQQVKQENPAGQDMLSELAALLDDLQREVQTLQSDPGAGEPAAAVKVQAERVITEATSDSPNRSLLRISADGLKQAAEFVRDVAPNLVATAAKIATLISKLPV